MLKLRAEPTTTAHNVVPVLIQVVKVLIRPAKQILMAQLALRERLAVEMFVKLAAQMPTVLPAAIDSRNEKRGIKPLLVYHLHVLH